MKNVFYVVALIAELLTPVAADAQFYVGVAGTDASYDEGRIDWPRLTRASIGFGGSSRSFEKHNDESKITLGYRFGKHFALEGGYHDLGQVNLLQTGFTFPEQDPGLTFPAFENGDGFVIDNATDISGPVLTVVGILPLKVWKVELELFAKAGIFAWSADSVASQHHGTFANTGGGTVFTPAADGFALEDDDSASGTSATYGFGLSVKLYKGLSLRAEVEQFDDVGGGSRISDLVTPENTPGSAPLTLGLETDLTTLSGGLIYRF